MSGFVVKSGEEFVTRAIDNDGNRATRIFDTYAEAHAFGCWFADDSVVLNAEDATANNRYCVKSAAGRYYVGGRSGATQWGPREKAHEFPDYSEASMVSLLFDGSVVEQLPSEVQ